jgi:hypothetical protein
MPKHPNTATVIFEVSGPDLETMVDKAAVHINGVDPDRKWRVDYRIQPEARTGAGEIISWRAVVTATSRW